MLTISAGSLAPPSPTAPASSTGTPSVSSSGGVNKGGSGSTTGLLVYPVVPNLWTSVKPCY